MGTLGGHTKRQGRGDDEIQTQKRFQSAQSAANLNLQECISDYFSSKFLVFIFLLFKHKKKSNDILENLLPST